MGETRRSKTNRDQVIAAVRANLEGSRGVRAQIGMQATTPANTPRFGDSKPRTEGENILILRTQQKAGRNPVFTRKDQDRAINMRWTKAINRVLRGDTLSLANESRDVAREIMKIIVGNIDAGLHIRGGMRRLKKGYAGYKERRWGKRPILEASGQLRRAFRIGTARL